MIDIQKLNEIDWSSYQYGRDTQNHLIDLFGDDQDKVRSAIDDLENTLCHQHVWVLPAIVPAFPFLVEALHRMTDVKSLGPLLEFFWGISRATLPTDRFYSIRALDLSWTSVPGKPSIPGEDHVREARKLLLFNRKLFLPFLNHQDNWVFESSAAIVSNFTETPAETSRELQNALSNEENPRRRYTLFYGLRELSFENKAGSLIQAFQQETDQAIKSEVAAQLVLEMKTASPPEIIDFLSEQVRSTNAGSARQDFFADLGIPLALARPETYNEVLQKFLQCLQQQSSIDYGTELLALAFCWNGKPDFDQLNSLQLGAMKVVYQKSWQGNYHYPSSSDFGYFSLPTTQTEVRAFLLERGVKLSA
jgi:hypothetical protein